MIEFSDRIDDTNDRMSQNCQAIALEEYLLKLQTQ